MAFSKIILNGTTLMDVTGDTVTSGSLLSGTTATKNDGTSVTGSIATKTSSDLTASGATVTAPAGYYASNATKTVTSGSARPASTISATAATVSTGTNTITLSKSVSNTPQVTAGYVSAGTAGNSSVSLTASVTTKAAATITPGTSNQTIAAGTYLTGAQTIAGDADLIASNIKSGVSIFNVTGSYSGGGGATNVVSGSFTTGATGGVVESVTIPYTGNGYPVAGIVFVDGGVYSSTNPFTDLVHRYALASFSFTKGYGDVAPDYTQNWITQNYSQITYSYKAYASSATSYTFGYSQNGQSYGAAAPSGTTDIMRFNSNTNLSYLTSDTTYGLATGIKYNYVILYSS